ncbi:MAG: 2-phosphosulfolactate phosphatase [Candidatus Glassbacteria bacterium]
MIVHRHSLLEGARAALGTAVIVDVFRAFTCASLLLDFDVTELLLAENPEDALRLKRDHGCLALGEVEGVMVEGFDLGNSPADIARSGRDFFAGRKAVLRTSAGVKGVFAAAGRCDRIYAASYTTVSALAKVLKNSGAAEVHIAAMGWSGRNRTPEDEQCARCLHSLLDPAVSYDHASALAEILTHESALKFLRGDKPHFPAADVAWCLQKDLFAFAMKVDLDGKAVVLRKEY